MKNYLKKYIPQLQQNAADADKEKTYWDYLQKIKKL